jgi:hypothetical protein
MPGSEAVEVAKNRRDSEESGRVTVMSTGVRARLQSVSAALIQDAIARVEEPQPPVWLNPETEEEEPNFVHPDHLKALSVYEQEQSAAALDAVLMFGIELEDGLPEDDKWLRRLKYMEKRLGTIDLSNFDLEDEMDQEYLYKRYIALGADDYALLANLSGVSIEEVARATRTFPGDEGRNPASEK